MTLLSFILHLLATYAIFGVLYYVIGGLTTGDWDGNGWFPLPIIIILCILWHPFFLADVLLVNPKPFDKTFIRCIYVIALLAVSMVWSVV